MRLACTIIAMTFVRHLIRPGRSCTFNLSSSYRIFHSTIKTTMRVVPVPVRSDNYAYLLIDEATKKAAAVDPFDVPKVQAQAEKEGVELTALITTHHHADHSGGNKEFHSIYPNAPVYGGSDNIPELTHPVKDGDTFSVGENIKVKCLATPCHTQDSICYYVQDTTQPDQKGVFTGDTLFLAGCGRFFEGTAPEMHEALSYLGTLPDETVVYNGHEYTKASLAFGAHIDPNAPGIDKLRKLAEESVTTGKSTIADEKQWNVFMRLDSDAVRAATKTQDDVEAMDYDQPCSISGSIKAVDEWKWDNAPRTEAGRIPYELSGRTVKGNQSVRKAVLLGNRHKWFHDANLAVSGTFP
ncbi:hypothetical protein RSOLAG1IB_01837 [Rhizoctonia solani AG-1 IB]|uniref:hydroxyacylglutathione hydrolase n=1 Tax=Thanatephorus cucumeris (strain AG1-IB / isolate 7/3/14) TaxID=1108050 RepID=A0A0B7FDY6_THACB|nr:hypothetical protein RSOLAG1IB_01837 [Rhizoctonia solani AG-1 IB]